MPEIKNTFTSGKMNKDLDERLVPNGQYTDALNVDVASSNTDNVGSVHNSYGNVRKDTVHSIGGKCIGSIVNKEDQTIIWFISGDSVDAIAEYNPTTDKTLPILVSPKENAAGAFLKFNNNRLITAINVLDGFLFWTDNYSEPKKINIKRGKAGRYTTSSSLANLWTTTTKLKLIDGRFGGNVLEKHLTVVRPYPINAPSLTLTNSTRPGLSSSTVKIPANTSIMPGDFGDGNNSKTCNIYGRGSGNTVQYYQNIKLPLSASVGVSGTTLTFTISSANAKLWQSITTDYYITSINNASYYKVQSIDYASLTIKVANYPGLPAARKGLKAPQAIGDLIEFVTFQEAYNNESFFTYKDSFGEVILKPIGISAERSSDLKDGGLMNNGSGTSIPIIAVQNANGFAPVSGFDNRVSCTSTGTTTFSNSSSITLGTDFIVGHIYEINIIATNYSDSASRYFGLQNSFSSANSNAGVGTSGLINSNGTISYIIKPKTNTSNDTISLVKQQSVAVDLSISIRCLSGPKNIVMQELIFEGQPDYEVGDTLKLSIQNPNPQASDIEDELNIRVKLNKENTDTIEQVSGYGSTGSNGSRKVFSSEIISIDSDVVSLTSSQVRGPWNVQREKADSLFQLNFPRFAYRWKYIDNEYSAISAFTSIAFLPKDEEYRYDAESGFNIVMENDVRGITLGDFISPNEDVVGMDILYKESNSTNIYSIESLKYEELKSLNTYTVSSEVLEGVLPSNQLLRPYDNTPRKAQSQEITANRLLYGNYTQQYNIDEKLKVISGVVKKEITDLKAVKSIKSIRNYQIGVGVLDKYGRQTPVFSSEEGIVKLSQLDSNNSTSFTAKVKSRAPSWASHYKYFIKDNSSEYYNLAMDRFYSAESDEHVWLSFPSCDANKVSEDDFLILKKHHDGSTPISESNTVKYKVLSKEAAAPDFIKLKKISIGRTSTGINFATNNSISSGYPLINTISFTVRSTSLEGFEQVFQEVSGRVSQSKKYIKIGSTNSGVTTDFYELDTVEWSVAQTKAGNVYYTFKLTTPFGNDISLTGTSPGSSTRGLYVEFFEERESTNQVEFEGRFFVKVLRDSVLNDHVLNSQAADNYIVINSQAMYWAHTYAVAADRNVTSGYAKFTETAPGGVIKVGSTYGGSTSSIAVPSDKFNSMYLKDRTVFKYLTDPTLRNSQGSWIIRQSVAAYDTGNGVVSFSQNRLMRGAYSASTYFMGGTKSTWCIDSAWSWPDSNQSFRLHNFGNNDSTAPTNKEMGEGFITGNNFANFRVWNLGSGAEANYNVGKSNAAPGGYKFPPKSKDLDNYSLYKQLTTIGTKFRFVDDPGINSDGKSTVYTILDKEIIPVRNFTTKALAKQGVWDSPTNKGVRIYVKLDRKITWSPCDEDALNIENTSANILYLNGGPTRKHISNTSTIEILQVDPSSNTFSTDDPAIFETEPKERADLNIFYETGKTDLILKDGLSISTDYINPATGVSALKSTAVINTVRGWDSNSFQISQNDITCHIPAGENITISKKDGAGNVVFSQTYKFDVIISSVVLNATKVANVWNRGVANTVAQILTLPTTVLDWHNCFSFGNGVESNRIRDDFNAPTIDKGPKASAVLDDVYGEEVKGSSIIYSGIYNKSSGVNNLNQFIQAEKITKDLNPEYGTIQKLFTRNTNVVAFCENKILKILANKDALFNADGKTNLVSTNKVLGQTIPFLGEFGISRNPESFANYGYRIYFTDKDRNAVIRLSGDGLTDISKTGMTTFFRDNFKQSEKVIGTYDEDKHNYNVTFNGKTVSYSEDVKGWTSLKSFIPESGLSLDDGYYTFFNKYLWKHGENEIRNNFYGVQAVDGSNVTFVFNESVSTVKNFKTLKYEGSKDWIANTIETDLQSGKINTFKDKEGLWFNYIKGVSTTVTNLDNKEFTTQGIGVPASVNLNGYNNYMSITATAVATNPKTYWSVNTAISNALNTENTTVNVLAVGLNITSYDVIFYIHSIETRTQTWSVSAADFTATISNTLPSTSPPTIGAATLVNLGTSGSSNNVIKVTVPVSGLMPAFASSFNVDVTGIAQLTQYLNPY